jgi:hypothetical protein
MPGTTGSWSFSNVSPHEPNICKVGEWLRGYHIKRVTSLIEENYCKEGNEHGAVCSLHVVSRTWLLSYG